MKGVDLDAHPTTIRAQLLLQQDRLRSAAELQDLVIQRVFAAGMSLQSVNNLIESPVARDRVSSVTDDLDGIVRALQAASSGISSGAAPQSLTSHINSVVHERSGCLGFTPELLVVGGVDDLPELVADQLVATLTEAVSNVSRHADATEATIRITRTDDVVSLVVSDNGCGIGVTPKPLGGLADLMWRAAELGGSCSVGPAEPSGTELVWQVPV